MDNAFIQQARRNVENLMISKKYREALDLCNAISSRYPEKKDFETLRKTVEEKLTEQNDETIDERMEGISQLWDQEKYAEILSELKELLSYSQNNKKLQKAYSKAQKLYTEQVDELKKKFTKNQVEKLTKLLEKDPDKVINELYILERSNPGNQETANLAKEFRGKLIHQKIKSKEDLIYSNKFELIISFIESLKKIDDKNTEIEKLEKLVKRRRVESMIEEKKELVYKGENYLDTLIRLKKYPTAIKVAEEILSIDDNDKTARKMLKKAKDAYFRQTRDQSVEMMEKDNKKLQEQYSANKKDFIKL